MSHCFQKFNWWKGYRGGKIFGRVALGRETVWAAKSERESVCLSIGGLFRGPKFPTIKSDLLAQHLIQNRTNRSNCDAPPWLCPFADQIHRTPSTFLLHFHPRISPRSSAAHTANIQNQLLASSRLPLLSLHAFPPTHKHIAVHTRAFPPSLPCSLSLSLSLSLSRSRCRGFFLKIFLC